MTISDIGQVHTRINSVEKEVATLSGEMTGLKNEMHGMRHDLSKFVGVLQNSKLFQSNGGNGKSTTWAVVSVLIMVFMILQIQIGFVWGISLRGYEELKEQMSYRDEAIVKQVDGEFGRVYDNIKHLKTNVGP